LIRFEIGDRADIIHGSNFPVYRSPVRREIPRHELPQVRRAARRSPTPRPM
jgi:hypothetical protein